MDENQWEIKLDPYKEFQVKICESSESVTVELLEGNAEIFGVEMIPKEVRTFISSFSVLTLQGCSLKVRGFASDMKTVTYNSKIYDLHQQIWEKRVQSQEHKISGPVILIAGPTDVGKSTLTKCLLNYAVRSSQYPLFVDLDIGQSSISIPGTVGVLPINHCGDIVNGYDDQQASIYFHGHKSPGFNILLYFLLISQLSKTIKNRMENSSEICNSGVIIDTCGWTTGQGYQSIFHAAMSFQVTTLLVLDDHKLYRKLQSNLPRTVEIIFMNKLKGVVVRNKTFRGNRRNKLIQDYFYGPQLNLKPYSFLIKYSDIQVIQFSCPTKVLDYMYDNPINYISIEKISFGSHLLNQVLAISYANTIDKNIIQTSILGFICITNIDFETQTITVMSPKPEPLPNNILIMGEFTYNNNV